MSAPYNNEVSFDLIVRGRSGGAMGFVRHTKGGLWRAYSYARCSGWGPFPTFFAALVWIRGGGK